MKTQRRPDRGRRKPPPDRNLPDGDLDMSLESELPDVEEFDTEDLENGAAVQQAENGAGAAGAASAGFAGSAVAAGASGFAAAAGGLTVMRG